MSSRDKDAEILALRHQVLVLQRRPGPGRVRFTPADRALLAALLHLWVPTTCFTWADALQSAVSRPAPGGPVLARPALR